MRTAVKVAIGVGAAVVVGGAAVVTVGPGLYADWANSLAADAPALTAPEQVTDADALADVDGDWTVATGSYAGYRVHEVLRGQDVDVTGRTDPASDDVTGALTVAEGVVTAAEIEVDVARITTDQPPRDAYFRDSVMEVGTYPTASFELTDPVPLEAAGTDVALTGDLTLRDVTREVTVTAQFAVADGGAQVVGSVPVVFEEFGVEAPSLGFVEVEDTGSVEFSLELQPQG
ncbi:YceI family protein [Isoptericola croceus]|uniref:YceI family protein n=1 Tax=Isoptericola croceus TaxID=3031406 RepID=UPI0023F96D4E|nr:YceI family protein [Isoptericola croceus]